MDFWIEIKPILGPLIQAAVVLIVGTATVMFQLSQARTARNKLFVDLHDKRYKALSSFNYDLTEMVRKVLDEGDNQQSPDHFSLEEQKLWRLLHSRAEELAWLFGPDVMIHLYTMMDHVQTIHVKINRLRHNLESDNTVELIASLNQDNDAFYNALAQTNKAAGRYLFIGDISRDVPNLDAWTRREEVYASRKLGRDYLRPFWG